MTGAPVFSPEDLSLPDDELGELLLGLFIADAADQHGLFPEIPDEFAEAVISQVRCKEASPRNAALEKALHKAADGNFEAAGRALRVYIMDHNVLPMRNARIALEEKEKNLRGPRKGGQARKAAVEVKNYSRDQKIWTEYKKLLGAGRAPREISAVLAQRFSLGATRIRQIIVKEKRKPA